MNDELTGLIAVAVTITVLVNLKKLSLLKMPEGLNVNSGAKVMLVVMWSIFVATRYYMHPESWDAWYEVEKYQYGGAQFWIPQIIMLGTLFAASKKDASFLVFVLLCLISWSYFTGYKGKEVVADSDAEEITNANNGPKSIDEVHRMTGVLTSKHQKGEWKIEIATLGNKFKMWQYSNVPRNNSVAIYNAGCFKNECTGDWSSENDNGHKSRLGGFKVTFVSPKKITGVVLGNSKDDDDGHFNIVLN